MVGMVNDVGRAFGMGQHWNPRMLRLQFEELGLRKGLVHDTDTRPEQHVATHLAVEVSAQMLVRSEDDFLVLRELVQDRFGRRAGDDYVAQRLNRRRAVYVRKCDMVRMGFPERPELFGRARIFEAAPCVHVGQDDNLLGRQDFGRFGHEADAAESDDIGAGRGRLAAEVEAVADKVGNVLDFGLLVIMGEDHGVALGAQAVDLGAKVEAAEAEIGCVHRPFPTLRSVNRLFHADCEG
jgi:hypothetical protein